MTSIGSVAEGSTIVVTIDVEDQEGSEQIPKTGVYTLLDSRGNIINSRRKVAISPLSASMEVGLTGDDLQSNLIPDTAITFIFEGTYDTTINGVVVEDMNIREESPITIEDIREIPAA